MLAEGEVTAVPRKREAVDSGLEIARSGGRAADPLVGRREVLAAVMAEALAAVSRDPDEAAKLVELAAANPEMRAKPLLEAYGQGATGPVRPLSWWRRNGSRVRKGERGYAVSMFGAYVFGRNQVVGPDPGTIGSRRTPPNALPDMGEGLALAILRARSGERLRAVWSEPELFTDEAPAVVRPAQVKPFGLAELEAAIAAVDAYDASADSCLSCDGEGCVLCSCQEGRGSRVSVKPPATVSPMPRAAETVRVQAKPKIGRPPKARPSLPSAAKAFRDADRLEARAKSVRVQAIRQAVEGGASLEDVGVAVGLSRARIHQILHGR